MFDFALEKKRFEEVCTACGECVRVCPIVPHTTIHAVDPAQVMESVLAVYKGEAVSDAGSVRIYSCMSCLTCLPRCPLHLDPAMGLSLARGILQNRGEPIPRGLSFLLPGTEFNLMKAIEAVQIKPDERPYWTDVSATKPPPAKTVLFTGCTGIMQPDMVRTALALIRRIDPTAQALGGVDYCCGDTSLRAGNPDAASGYFCRLLEGLDAFSPQNVVFLCPTCKFMLDLHAPETDWTGYFITAFLAERLNALGPFSEVRATVTVHDPCHLVRAPEADTASARKLAAAIPGVALKEMESCGKESLCCGGSAMATMGKPGMDLRARRLKQAQDAGAEIMVTYCPGCQSVFIPTSANLPFKVESLIVLLGRSMGIFHEDLLLRYLGYRDAQRVVSETEDCVAATDLPKEKLIHFMSKYFK